MKILIDTNVFIGLEDPGIVETKFADLTRIAATNDVDLFVHEASLEDVKRDLNTSRRESTESRFVKFRSIKTPRRFDKAKLARRFGPIGKDNDLVDVLLLDALDRNAADLLVTEDKGIRRRARAAGLSDRVFTTLEAAAWLQNLFEAANVTLPAVQDVYAYEIDFSDSIFDELRSDYPGFNKWADKCRTEHRPCWIVYEGDQIAGVVIRKDETHAQAETVNLGEKILKLCTFKVAAASRGRKLGEQLLKQALWHCQLNNYDLVYVTAFDKQESLIWLLEEFGFHQTRTLENGELVFEKPIKRGPLVIPEDTSALSVAREYYPRFDDGTRVKKFAIPIKPTYHKILFPECWPNVDDESVERPGNTIHKVYLTHSRSTKMSEGSLIFFYLSKSGHPASQSITSVGVISGVSRTSNLNELVRLTAKRSAYPENELRELVRHGQIAIIDFLLIGHLEQPISLQTLETRKILNGPPQSVTSIGNYRALKRLIDLGFEI
jgi:ribosomal protein S18 acetylase RimI-like enzyme